MGYVFYSVAFLFLGISFMKDRRKTIQALRRSWMVFKTILPQLLGILLFTGLLLAYTSPETISRIIGQKSGWLGTLGAAVIGSLTLIPGFVALPMCSLLIENGAGYLQIGAFVSTLMMVGVVTFPMEKLYFGTRTALIRNGLAFVFSFLVAFVIDWVHRG
ncbi:MAG: permease [Spirochaetales bacterium]